MISNLTGCSHYLNLSHSLLLDKPLICYLYNQSPMKVNQSHNDYQFDVTLQMKDKALRGICFSPDLIR